MPMQLLDHPNKLRDDKKYKEAILAYESVQSEDEEVQWYCSFQIAMCKMLNRELYNTVIEHLMKAFEKRLWRVEPVYYLLQYLRAMGMSTTAFWLGKTIGMLVEYPIYDVLFIEEEVYKGGFNEEMAINAKLSGHNDEYLIYKNKS